MKRAGGASVKLSHVKTTLSKDYNPRWDISAGLKDLPKRRKGGKKTERPVEIGAQVAHAGMSKKPRNDANHRWDVNADLQVLPPRAMKGQKRPNHVFLEGAAAARPELVWTRAAKKWGLNHCTAEGILEHSWRNLEVEDAMAEVSLYNICQVYGPAMRTILQLKVLHRVVDVFLCFG